MRVIEESNNHQGEQGLQGKAGRSLGSVAWLPRNRADLHNLLYHGLLVTAYGLAFWLYQHPGFIGIEGPWEWAAMIVGWSFMLGWASGVNVAVNFHNHAHLPIFSSETANRWLSRFWAVTAGWPAFFFAYAHIEVHHGYLMTGRDWTLPKRRADGGFESIVTYSLFYWPFRVAWEFVREFTTRVEDSALQRRALLELFLFVAVWSVPFWVDPLMALLLWVLPQWIGNVMLVGAGMYAQHAGCVSPSDERPHEHSNTCVSPLHNLTMFNIGYHISHHEYPKVHWSRLPRLHRKLHAHYHARGARFFDYGYYKTGRIMSSLTQSWSKRHSRLSEGFAYREENPNRRFDAASAEDRAMWEKERAGEGGEELAFRQRARPFGGDSTTHFAPELPEWVTAPGPVGLLARAFGYSFWAWCAIIVVSGTILWGPWVSLAFVLLVSESAKRLI